MQSKQVVMRVSELASKICAEYDLALWDVLFEKEGRDYMLSVFIDSERGIFIEDCEKVSRALDGPLDQPEFDTLPPYTLVVSSPGVERKIRKPEHFKWALGRMVDVGLYKPQGGVREFTGRLLTYDEHDGAILLGLAQTELAIAGGDYAKISIHFDF